MYMTMYRFGHKCVYFCGCKCYKWILSVDVYVSAYIDIYVRIDDILSTQGWMYMKHIIFSYIIVYGYLWKYKHIFKYASASESAMHVHMCMWMCIHTSTCEYVKEHLSVYQYVSISVSIHVNMWVCMCGGNTDSWNSCESTYKQTWVYVCVHMHTCELWLSFGHDPSVPTIRTCAPAPLANSQASLA